MFQIGHETVDDAEDAHHTHLRPTTVARTSRPERGFLAARPPEAFDPPDISASVGRHEGPSVCTPVAATRSWPAWCIATSSCAGGDNCQSVRGLEAGAATPGSCTAATSRWCSTTIARSRSRVPHPRPPNPTTPRDTHPCGAAKSPSAGCRQPTRSACGRRWTNPRPSPEGIEHDRHVHLAFGGGMLGHVHHP